ncbi:hypothetical protein FRB99_003992 [Tulasnella sp. 403]|nr:hypothetical protein FRB99_003992 [Tulasnella sp. 403]
MFRQWSPSSLKARFRSFFPSLFTTPQSPIRAMSTTANATYGHKEHNYTMLQAFEWYVDGDGKHLSKVKSELPRLDHMGITAMWLPPPTKASSTNSVGYDVYDIWDLGEFDQKGARGTKFGSKEELVDTIKTAKDKFGIITYIDAVLNHKFGADRTERFKAVEVAWDDRTRNVSDPYDIEGWTAFDFTGRGGKYSDFKWNFNHFTGVDYNAENGKKAIYKILGDNKGWALAVDSENKNYDYLMGADIDHAHPDVQKDLFNWGNWVLQETGAFGFRFDAIKHIDENFMREFVKHVRASDGYSQVFCVGEFWKDSLTDLEAYLGRFSEQFSVFDTPLHYNFKQASDEGDRFDLRSIWDGSLVKNMPVDAV